MSKSNRLSGLLHKLFHNNRFVAVFSTVTALIMWLVISISENPQRTTTISGVPLNINTQGTIISTLGMEIVSGHIETVDVAVSGPSYIVSSLKSSDINVSASLSDVTGAGTYELKLRAVRGSSKTGYDIVGVSPDKVTVTFDVVDTKSFEIEPVALGASASEGLIAEPVVSNPANSSITVSGPRTVMSRIAKVTAEAEFNEVLSKKTEKTAELKFYDEKGDLISEEDINMLDLPFNSMDIAVQIFKEKTLPVVMNSKSSTAALAIPHTFSSNTVVVRGEPSVVDAMSYAELENIDMSKISTGSAKDGKVMLTPEFVLPSSVRTVGAEHFEVIFDLHNYASKTIRVTSMKTIGTGSGTKAVFASKYVEVTLCGPIQAINSVKADDIVVYADCTGKVAGVYSITCTVEITNYPSVWSFGTVTTSVTIE